MRNAKSVGAIAALVALSVLATTLPAAAQGRTRVGEGPHFRRPQGARIEIHPRPLRYRRCKDWYVIQHRPSGTVLFPEYHCWWVRG